MSGVKCYKIPSFTKEVFKGKMNEILYLQEEIRTFIARIKEEMVQDRERGIVIDETFRVDKLKDAIERGKKSFHLPAAQFNKEEKDRVELELEKKAADLQELKKELGQIAMDAHAKVEDYRKFISYERICRVAEKSLQDYRVNIAGQLEWIEKETGIALPEAKKQVVQHLGIQLKTLQFSAGFSVNFDACRQEVIVVLTSAENELNEVLKEFISQTGYIRKEHEAHLIQNEEYEQKKKKVIQKIRNLICACEDNDHATTYTGKMNRVLNSSSLKDIFPLQQLHDEILEAEKTRRNRSWIKDSMATIAKKRYHKDLGGQKSGLFELFNQYMQKHTIKDGDIALLKNQVAWLEKQERNCVLEEMRAREEKAMIKRYVAEALVKRGYMVEVDTQVIDFEKNDEVFLATPGKDNLLRLDFDGPEKLSYGFFIPQDKAFLNSSQLDEKLVRMEETCADFKDVVQNLSGLGICVVLENETPACMDAIHSIPAEFEHVYRDIIANRSDHQKRGGQRQKYLD